MARWRANRVQTEAVCDLAAQPRGAGTGQEGLRANRAKTHAARNVAPGGDRDRRRRVTLSSAAMLPCLTGKLVMSPAACTSRSSTTTAHESTGMDPSTVCGIAGCAARGVRKGDRRVDENAAVGCKDQLSVDEGVDDGARPKLDSRASEQRLDRLRRRRTEHDQRLALRREEEQLDVAPRARERSVLQSSTRALGGQFHSARGDDERESLNLAAVDLPEHLLDALRVGGTTKRQCAGTPGAARRRRR